MARAFINNRNGFTLIENLVAMFILSVGLLGLLQAVNYSIHYNMDNQLRDDAVRLADERMAVEKSRTFDAIPVGASEQGVRLNVLNTFKNYSVVTTTTQPSYSVKNIEIDVYWSYKGQRRMHVISSVVARQ